jgi:hypothetical protein
MMHPRLSFRAAVGWPRMKTTVPFRAHCLAHQAVSRASSTRFLSSLGTCETPAQTPTCTLFFLASMVRTLARSSCAARSLTVTNLNAAAQTSFAWRLRTWAPSTRFVLVTTITGLVPRGFLTALRLRYRRVLASLSSTAGGGCRKATTTSRSSGSCCWTKKRSPLTPHRRLRTNVTCTQPTFATLEQILGCSLPCTYLFVVITAR